MKQNIFFIYPDFSTFVREDHDILSSKHIVINYRFKSSKNLFQFVIDQVKLFIYLVLNIRKIDVIYCWFADYHSFLPTLFGKIFNRKNIIIVGGYDAVSVPEINYGIFYKKNLRALCAKWSYKMANYIVPVDKSLDKGVNYYADKKGLKTGVNNYVSNISAKIEVIPTGYDSEKWFKIGGVNKLNTVLAVAGGHEIKTYKLKGIDLLLQIAKRLPKINFVIIGLKGELKIHALKFASENVKIYDYIQNNQLINYYSMAKVFCQLSLTEGLPNTLCEAMLCECTPIGSSANGIPNGIGDCGYILKERNIEKGAELIKRAIESDINLGIKARQRMIDHFSIEKRKKSILNLLSNNKVMIKRTYKIFDKIVEINFTSNHNILQQEALFEQLDLYTKIDSYDKSDIEVFITDEVPRSNAGLINPSIHTEIENGFACSQHKFAYSFQFKDKLIIHIALKREGNKFISYLKKLNNIEYASINERLGQIFFELIMVPSIYFDPDKFLIHCSSFNNPNGEAILIGGTGGVGKTSLEIELCMNRKYSFVSDDIAVLNNKGEVLPNLAFPKIYAYNLVNNSKLKKEIFKKRSIDDKLAWKFKTLLLGANKVRRKVSPASVYHGYEKDNVKASKYFILMRENRSDISVQKVDARTAAEMSIKVIQTEYAQFNNHILWHEFNCLSNNANPILSLKEVINNWENKLVSVLNEIDCQIIFIPKSMPHSQFIKEVSDIITG